jgi:hypothetical protein
MMPFSDFLAKAHKVFRSTDWMDPRVKIPSLEESHIFHLGEDEDFNSAVNEIDEDVKGEMKDVIPMPFKDVACVSLVRKPMEEARVKQLNNTIVEMFNAGTGGDLVYASGGKPVWVMDRIIEVDAKHPMIEDILQQKWKGVQAVDAKQWFIFVRVHGAENVQTMPMLWSAGYGGIHENGKVLIFMLEAAYPLANEVAEGLRYVTAISHPANYIVKVTPKLTPRESRRVEAGKTYPDPKTPHFLIVDHDVIVGMRRDPQGTHASPVPHERRGHWRRLAERCRHAKLLGKDKVYVRPSLIGEPKFEDAKNLYEVLPDFQRKVEEKV